MPADRVARLRAGRHLNSVLALDGIPGVAIVPAPLSTMRMMEQPREALPALSTWVRGTLVGIALGWVVVFGVAWWLKPYDENGRALRMETHRQLGLPPCTFYTLTGGWPCPSCGMTTSFALLVRGDIWNSLQANFVGTLLALFGMVLVPWNLLCAWRGRTYFIASIELALLRIVIVFLVLLLVRWAIVLAVEAPRLIR